MAEWLKAAVLKTVSGVTRSGVRIPLPPPLTEYWYRLTPPRHPVLQWTSGRTPIIKVST